MKERYSYELPKWMAWLGIWRVSQGSIEFKNGYFAPRFGFEAKFHRGGYFDQRCALSLCLIWGMIYVKLPFKTSLEEDCEWPEYGIAIHNQMFWLYTGGPGGNGGSTMKAWDLPYFSYEFEGHRVQLQDGSWVEAIDSWKSNESDGRYTETHPYKYTLSSGEVQEKQATVYKESRQWHRKWFPWIKMNRTEISIEFSDEVGERSGSWKGGCIGCGYDVIKGETMLQTLQRMEKERKFK